MAIKQHYNIVLYMSGKSSENGSYALCIRAVLSGATLSAKVMQAFVVPLADREAGAKLAAFGLRPICE
ncbi:hypothetical protein DPMN_179129 [Dreissena polymorpha]|uniref:Uncharacterized protein n=1 Tax=Dreissena polymorpha TaxID=45954 RepID=A0A9D4IJA6_DREPO|nr:hypothetical protein DPMN_179129 [Dreissena polymorpha]